MGLGRLLRNPSSSRRLDASNETALAASIHNLRLEESGWIMLKEAKELFSEMTISTPLAKWMIKESERSNHLHLH